MKEVDKKNLRNILGPQKEKWHTGEEENDLYRPIENVSDTIGKRRLKFYGHHRRKNERRLSKNILKYMTKIKATTKWNNKNIGESWDQSKEFWNKEVFQISVNNTK